jgi:hypothetical protein
VLYVGQIELDNIGLGGTPAGLRLQHPPHVAPDPSRRGLAFGQG